MEFVLVIAVALGGLRLAGVTHIAFQAPAHLFIGGLIGNWLATRRVYLIWTVAALTVLEVAAFVAFKNGMPKLIGG